MSWRITQPLTGHLWTGTGPDIYQDGQIARAHGEVIQQLARRSKTLKPIQDALVRSLAVAASFPFYGEDPNAMAGTKINRNAARAWKMPTQYLLLKILKAPVICLIDCTACRMPIYLQYEPHTAAVLNLALLCSGSARAEVAFDTLHGGVRSSSLVPPLYSHIQQFSRARCPTQEPTTLH